MRAFAIASTVVASASVALAGSATINNNCDHDVYVWQVADVMSPCSTVSPGGSWTQPYQTRESGGCSVKIGKEDNIWGGIPITQFEYTYTPGDSFSGLWYDMSNINGDPFSDVDTSIVPHLDSGVSNTTNCNVVSCPPGGHCVDAYNVPDDNLATHSCPAETNLVFNLCGTGSGNSGSNSGSSSSAPASSPAPVHSSPAPSAPAYSAPAYSAPAHSAAPSAPAPQTTVVTVKVPAATPTPAQAPSSNAYALSWTGEGVVHEGAIGKREAHENHMERHARIARMHHARSNA